MTKCYESNVTGIYSFSFKYLTQIHVPYHGSIKENKTRAKMLSHTTSQGRF